MRVEPRKRKRVLLAGASVAVLALAFWFLLLRNSEPVHDGRRLSEWVEMHREGSSMDQREAAVAIQAIGTNALPHLVEWLAYQPSGLRSTLESMVRHGPNWLAQSQRIDAMLQADNRRANCAAGAFVALGSAAAPAIPELERIARRKPENQQANALALESLGYIGPQAIPTLTNLLVTVEYDALLRVTSLLSALQRQGTKASMAFPVLFHQLQSENPDDVWAAADSLKSLRFDAERVVPVLVARVADTNSGIQISAIYALSGFGRAAVQALPALTNALSDPDPMVRVHASAAIERIIGSFQAQE